MAEVIEVEVDVSTNADQAEGKLGSLKSQIRETTQAMQKLELQGKATGDQYEKLRSKLDGLNDAQDRAKFKAGQFEDRLASLPGPLGQLGSGIKTAGDSFATFGKTLTVSLGIVGLLVAAFFAIKEALSKTKEGQEGLSKAMSAFNSVVAPLFAILEKVGNIVLPIITKGFEALGSVMNKVAKFFGVSDDKITEVTGSLEQNNEMANKLAADEEKRVAAANKLQEDKDRKNKESAAKAEQLRKEAKAKRDADLKEIQDGQKEAMLTLMKDQERETFQVNEKYSKLIFLATKYGQDTADLKEAQLKELAAIDDKYAKEAKDKLDKANKEKEDAEKEKQDKAKKDKEDADKKAQEDAQKKADAESQARVDAANLIMADYNLKKTLGDATFQDELTAFDNTRALEKKDMEAKGASAAAIQAFEKETAAARIEIERAQQEAKMGIISNALGAIANAVGANTVAGKALAIAQATIDTYMGANKALGTYPPPFGAIAAGTVILAGLMNVKKIVSTQIPKVPGQTGGGGSAGSAPSITPPTIPTIATPQINTTGGMNPTTQIAQTIGAAQQRPIQAYVVSQQVSSTQALDRRTNAAATFSGG
jgi:chemotaxis protein histidine kinase CheA